MAKESIADIFSGKDEQQGAGAIHRLFAYLSQNPNQYPQVREFLIKNHDIDPEDLPENMTAQQMGAVAQSLQAYAGAAPQGIGDMLAAQGRNGDTMIAHINPQEAHLLQAVGGSGTINPATGMPEFGVLKKFFKRVVKPLVGAVIGFAVGGPAGAMIGAGIGEGSHQMSEATKAQERAAKEQAQIMQEAEETRQAEAAAEAQRIRDAETRRQENIALGSGEIASVFGQFNDDFFNRRATDYVNYAMPQLDREFQDEQRRLVSSLARSGNLNSSLRGDLMGRLTEQYNSRRVGIQDEGNRLAQNARSQVEEARARLLESNAQLADPGTIRTMAQARASGVSVSPQYESLGDMIAGLSGSIPSGPMQAGVQGGGGMRLHDPIKGGSGRLVG